MNSGHIQVGSLEVGSFHTDSANAPRSHANLMGVVWEIDHLQTTAVGASIVANIMVPYSSDIAIASNTSQRSQNYLGHGLSLHVTLL